jgi:hypothetical protein
MAGERKKNRQLRRQDRQSRFGRVAKLAFASGPILHKVVRFIAQ